MALTETGDISCQNLTVSGNLAVAGTKPSTARTYLTEDEYQSYDIPFTSLRIWDAYQTAITTAAADDLGLTAGAFGTGVPYVTAGDLDNAGATTRYCRFEFMLPPEYVSAGSVRLAITGGMLTAAVANNSCTVDAEVYEYGSSTLVAGSDLCATAAQSINSNTYATVTFEINAAGLVAGDKLDVRLAIACNDTAASAATTPTLTKIAVQADIKG